ncbi:hypothetical protein [Phenylobacterium sp.]|uniref:hypothetical protein n=1 Tax=Phenylobacterium sp. TaxID=1871053 RepID=UPI002737FBC4|nr:hypothetical protein [Phenylobacterium sp.]MDP3869196.1 hypothetical protein [Phenylobacterium sp.]
MAGTTISALTAAAALGGTEAIPGVQSAANVKITPSQIKTFTSASPTLVTPALGVATATSLAIGGATIGSNALAVTGTSTFSAAIVLSGNLQMPNNNGGIYMGATYDLILSRPAAATFQHGAADAAAPVAQTLKFQDVVAGTSNTAGVNATIQAPAGTGTGAGGSLIFQVAPAGSSGSAKNAWATVLTLDANRTATFTGRVKAPSSSFFEFDGSTLLSNGGVNGALKVATNDSATSFTITAGASNLATFNGGLSTGGNISLPASNLVLFAGRGDMSFTGDGVVNFRNNATTNSFNITIGAGNLATFNGGITAGGAIQAAGNVGASAGGGFNWVTRSQIYSPSDGVILLTNNALADFNRLQFGGQTSSFPAIKRSTTTLQARLADDSAFTAIQGKLTTDTAYTAGDPTTTGYLVVYDSTGTAYRVPALAN